MRTYKTQQSERWYLSLDTSPYLIPTLAESGTIRPGTSLVLPSASSSYCLLLSQVQRASISDRKKSVAIKPSSQISQTRHSMLQVPLARCSVNSRLQRGNCFLLNNGQALHSESCDLGDWWALQATSKCTSTASLGPAIPFSLCNPTT